MVQADRAEEISAVEIGKRFGALWALRDLSLVVRRGEFLTLLGPSGSGKTTFLMILAGFEAPSTGRLLEDGVDITARPAEDRAFGMVFQGYALFPHMSVEANIAFPLQVRRMASGEIRKRVADMIGRLGLAGHEKKLPSQLSGGQQQRVALARALVFEPAVLLLDEPFSALDKNLRVQMQAEVRRLHEELGTTFVFVTHDQSEALALSSRVAIFNHGRLLQVDTPQAVYERPVNHFVAEFLGEINMLPLTGVSHDNGLARGRYEEREVALALGADGVGAEAVLAIRPEHMSVASEAPSAGNGIPATATASTFLGSATRLELATRSGQKLSVSVPADAAAAAMRGGDAVWLTWPSDKGFLLPAERAV